LKRNNIEKEGGRNSELKSLMSLKHSALKNDLRSSYDLSYSPELIRKNKDFSQNPNRRITLASLESLGTSPNISTFKLRETGNLGDFENSS
jgi:hypothetical protein